MRDAVTVIRAVLRNRDLLRVEVAYAGFNAAEFAVWVAMLVYAYDQGGATTAGVVALAQLVPAALFAPVAGMLADRHGALTVLSLGYLAQGLGMGATAASLLLGGPPVLSYALAAVAATAVTTTRPTQSAVAPGLARVPSELTAVNVVSGWIASSMILAGPAIAGGLLAVSSPGWVFAVFAAVALGSAALVAPLLRGRPELPAEASDDAAPGALEDLAAGLHTLREHPGPRLIVLLLGLEYFCWGALDVLAVVLAVDVLDLGDGGAGYLTAAFGAGCLAGSSLAVLLVGRRHLVVPLLAGALLWGAGFALVGAIPSVAAAFLLLALGGVGRSVLDVSGQSLLQRIAPPEVLARVFGAQEALAMAGLALGSIVVPALVAAGDAVTAFAVTGGLLVAFVLLRLPSFLRLDAAATVPVVEIALLRAMRFFGALPPPALEGLARSLEPVTAAAGEVVIRQGERGDRFYAIADGEVEVEIDGRPVAVLSRADGFGEVALLRDVPRTATVRALCPAQLYALAKEPFLLAVTGHLPAHRTAEAIAEERVGPVAHRA